MLWFNKLIAALLPFLPKRLVWLFSKRYIAGICWEDAEAAARAMNASGCVVTVDLLGEFITEMEAAEANGRAYHEILDKLVASGVDGNISLKPTMFGLLLDEEGCTRIIRGIVARAAEKGQFVRIDMEDSSCVDQEIALYRKLKKEFPGHVGLVLQAYLRRTHADLEAMLDMHEPDSPLNFRLCKGIYVEPPEVAWQGKDEIRKCFLEDLEFMLSHGIYVGIATHDTVLVEGACALLEKHQVSKEGYEFQMLYGVTPALRKSLLDAGHPMRIYVPFGAQWFAYSTRRLKENPSMANDIVKALFVRG